MIHGVFFGRLTAGGLARQRLTHVVRRCSNWKPVSFDETFKVPARNQPLHLETKHFHPIDQHLSFDELSHKYRFDNKPLRLSVTQVVGNYFEKFVPEEAVRIMMNGSNWPRPQYCDVNGVPHTAEQIMQEWEQIGEKARNEGTYMHWNIERHLNDLEITAAIPEFKQYLQFYHDNILAAKIRPYRTEWRIAAPDLGLGGSVDFVGQREDGSFVLMDWKRSKNLPFSMYKAYGKYGREPLTHVPDCDGSKYSLQLNLYRYILGKYYGINVSHMMLASFHPGLRAYFKAEVPVMDDEVALIVQDLKAAAEQTESEESPT